MAKKKYIVADIVRHFLLVEEYEGLEYTDQSITLNFTGGRGLKFSVNQRHEDVFIELRTVEQKEVVVHKPEEVLIFCGDVHGRGK